MPTVIPASNWNLNLQDIDTSLEHNHPQQFSTEEVLKSLDELDASKEICELTEMVINSPLYANGTRNA